MLAGIIYILCAVASLGCSWLLVRSFLKTRVRMLLWIAIGFAGLTANNLLLVVDLVIFPEAISLLLWRSLVALVGLTVMLFGLLAEARWR